MRNELTCPKRDLQQLYRNFLSGRKQVKSLQREWQKGYVQKCLFNARTVGTPGSVACVPGCQTGLGPADSSAPDCPAHDKLSTIRSLFPAYCQAEKVIHAWFIILWRRYKLLAKHFHHI